MNQAFPHLHYICLIRAMSRLMKIVVVSLLDRLIIAVAASNSMNDAETGTEVVRLGDVHESFILFKSEKMKVNVYGCFGKDL